jgi:hypothetical protein
MALVVRVDVLAEVLGVAEEEDQVFVEGPVEATDDAIEVTLDSTLEITEAGRDDDDVVAKVDFGFTAGSILVENEVSVDK